MTIRILTWFIWLLIFGWACAAHASPVPPVDPPWSSDRIAGLPREIRERVLSACGPHARAGHYFATYDPNSDAIHLNYALLECPDLSRFGGGIGEFHPIRPSSDVAGDTSCCAAKEMFATPASSASFGRGTRLGFPWLSLPNEVGAAAD